LWVQKLYWNPISLDQHVGRANSAGLPHSCAVPGVRCLSVSSDLYLDALGCVSGLLKALSLHSTVIHLCRGMLPLIVCVVDEWCCMNLVDPASSHMLVSKIKPCMSQYKLLYGETANGSLKQL
jgi:hypothetical protein